ncbi:MAG: terminase large subunit domain-containing protein, partial [Vicinamibacteraceae bacterium]
MLGALFGLKAEDGYRRHRVAYIEAGKGSGKTPLQAGIGLYMLIADAEPGAQIVFAAFNQRQASIAFADAVSMVRRSESLSKVIEIYGASNPQSLLVPAREAWMKPVSKESRGLHGLRVHCGLMDELHAHPDSFVRDRVFDGMMKQQRQPLMIEITNAGHDRMSVCWAHHEYSRKVLEGLIDDPSWFAFV